HDPALRARVTVKPVGSSQWGHVPQAGTLPTARGHEVGRGSKDEHQPRPNGRKVTTAEVLEAIHQATGLPVVADFYTHLYPAGSVAVTNRPVFEALNQLADTMHMRWNKEGAWLQF